MSSQVSFMLSASRNIFGRWPGHAPSTMSLSLTCVYLLRNLGVRALWGDPPPQIRTLRLVISPPFPSFEGLGSDKAVEFGVCVCETENDCQIPLMTSSRLTPRGTDKHVSSTHENRRIRGVIRRLFLPPPSFPHVGAIKKPLYQYMLIRDSYVKTWNMTPLCTFPQLLHHLFMSFCELFGSHGRQLGCFCVWT